MAGQEDYKERVFPITADSVRLEADLVIPPQAEGIVLLVNSTSKGRYGASNQFIARVLQESGLATAAINLLTLHEEASDWHTKYLLFNSSLLAERLNGATDWLASLPATQGLKMGYWGTGIEAGAALLAAAKQVGQVGAIACFGGRLDLATAVFPAIQMPILLLVSQEDSLAQRINQNAFEKIPAEKRLELIAGSARLNEQSETLEKVADLLTEWFKQHLCASKTMPEERLVEWS
jgi:putative phosphoribosyl transferase